MPLVPNKALTPVGRIGAAAQNAFEVARFGGLETGEQPADYDVLARTRIYRLRRYFPDQAGNGEKPPVILVPPMMLAAEVYDVSPQSSAVAVLHEHGIDPWVVDFGSPEHEEGGLERNLTDHVLAVSDAVDRVARITGRDVHLGGYSQGGMFCYQTAAYRRGEGIDSLITFGSPVDTHGALPLGIPESVAEPAAVALAEILGRTAVPAWMSRTGFRLLDPVKSLRQRLDFLLQLHDRESLLPREGQRRFLMGEGWVAWPGPALADFMRQFIAHNRMLQGGFVIEDRLVTLADIDCPLMTVVGTVDEIAPPKAVRAVRRAAPRSEVYELPLPAGHFGLVVGGTATRTTWPAVAQWMQWRASAAELPEELVRVDDAYEETAVSAPRGARLGFGLELAAGVGSGLARSVGNAALNTVNSIRVLTEEVTGQLPRLARLGRLEPHTRISTGLLLDEQAEDSPDGVFFLFEDRAFTHAAVKYRVDSVVRGFISLGVRQGEHVGVLMGPRPTGLSVVAALNRLGAVAVLMRPDGPVETEARLGEVTRIVADPELAERAKDAGIGEVLVLGGGAEERDLGEDVIDMERIDPEQVELPAWYRPNPGRASDLAFILFTGEGRNTRANHITNGRWALSAFGTASAAALSSADTVYSMTPIHHPSGLLMSIGGAVAGGSRLALAKQFDPTTFWSEARRYGVTVASYTWTMLRAIADAPPDPGERHHSVRLFIGAGMPRGLWRRVAQRFEPARVLEFYASTEGEAILVNITGAKAGCKGKPLPGSAEVKLAAYDIDARQLRLRTDGFVRECAAGEAGMLLTRMRGVVSPSEIPLRGVFDPDDAWLPTGDLFRTDEDGDFWLIDHAPALIQTARGHVASFPIQDALGDVDAIDLVVTYGVDSGRPGTKLAIAAVTLLEDFKLDAATLEEALSDIPEDERPDLIAILDEIPVTTWYRPAIAKLRKRGVPEAGDSAWCLEGGRYVRLTERRREKLTGEQPVAS